LEQVIVIFLGAIFLLTSQNDLRRHIIALISGIFSSVAFLPRISNSFDFERS
jgi:hypothetical protein